MSREEAMKRHPSYVHWHIERTYRTAPEVIDGG